MTLRILSIGISAVVLLGMVGFLATKVTAPSIVDILGGMLFFLPFYGFPPIVSIGLSVYTKSPVSQIMLATTSLLYGVWFAYAMYAAFYVHIDPQSALIIIFVGIYFLPVLLPLWITALVIEIRYRKKRQQVAAEP